jgi:hypothetical protein
MGLRSHQRPTHIPESQATIRSDPERSTHHRAQDKDRRLPHGHRTLKVRYISNHGFTNHSKNCSESRKKRKRE